MNASTLELIKQHYIYQQKFARLLNKQTSGNDFERISDSKEFTKLCEEFAVSFGVFGGGYAVINRPLNSLIFLQNKELHKIRIKSGLPFAEFQFKFPDEGLFEGNPIKSLKRSLVSLLFESEYTDLQLDVEEATDSPKFLHNLPPYESIHGLPTLPSEKAMREDGAINFLYCPAGEILFFLYAWNWLKRCAQAYGLNGEINLLEPKLNTAKAKNIWRQSFWYEMPKSPEKNWLKVIREAGSWWKPQINNITYEELLSYWREITTYSCQLRNNTFSFTEDWPMMGLSSQNGSSPNLSALLSFTKHLLKRLPVTLSAKKKRTYYLNFTAEDNPVSFINAKIDEILQEREEGYKEILIDNLFSLGQESDEHLHYILRKAIFETLSHRQHCRHSIRMLLAILHKKARFPVLPYFFQMILSPDKTPFEHFVFPISTNHEFPAKAKIPNGAERAAPIQTVVLGIFSIEPPWKSGISNTKKPTGSASASQKMDYPSADNYARLSKIQEVVRQVSQSVVDKGFYSSVIRPGIERRTTLDYQDKISHEIKKISNSIFIKSNLEITKLFELRVDQQIEVPKDKAGAITIAREEQLEELKNWLVIPNTQRFLNNQTLLNTWIGVKDIASNYSFEKATSLSDIMVRFVAISKEVRATRNLQGFGKPKNIMAIRAYEEKYKRELEALNKNITVEYALGQNLIWQPKVSYLDDDSIEIKKTAFIQLMLASLVNAFEHSKNWIRIESRVENDQLALLIKNQHDYEPYNLGEKKVGTRAVLDNCLRQLEGHLEFFGFRKEEFLTAFSFPYRAVFILDIKSVRR